jgi:phosphohistidine phosphatase
MKKLTLLRHAKSASGPLTMRDFDRPLNGRGRRGARAIGREMRKLGLAFDAILASPAQRALETVAEVSAEFGPVAAAYDQRLYLADLHSLFEIVRETGDEADRLLLVGHNPGLEMLALALAETDGGPLRRSIEVKYPTGSLAEIALDVQHWREVAPGSGRITHFIRPRDLDPELGPEDWTARTDMSG